MCEGAIFAFAMPSKASPGPEVSSAQRSDSTSLAACIALATGVRLIVACTPLGQLLQRRIETTSPLDSPVRLREAVFWVLGGRSPYSGWAYHAPPLVFPLWAPFVGPQAPPWLYIAPCCAADALAALLLASLARSLRAALQAGDAAGAPLPSPTAVAALYLFNPYQLLSSCSGSLSGLELAAVLATLRWACAGTAWLAGLGLAVASYLSLHAALLLPALVLLLARGPEQVWQPFSRAELGVPTPSKHFDQTSTQGTVNTALSKLPVSEAAITGSAIGCTREYANSAGGSNIPLAAGKRMETSMARATLQLVGWAVMGWLALVHLSDVWLSAFPEHRHSNLASVVWSMAGASPAGGRRRGAQHWLWHTYAYMLQVQDLTPNIGLYWYYMAELFPHFQPFFRAVLHMLAAGFALPLAIRLHTRPLLVATAQLVATAMLKPYPTAGDMAKYMALLPLLPQVVQRMGLHMVMPLALALVSALSPVMWNLWLVAASANPNFYWSMSLLLGAWHAALLIALVSGAIKLDRMLLGKP